MLGKEWVEISSDEKWLKKNMILTPSQLPEDIKKISLSCAIRLCNHVFFDWWLTRQKIFSRSRLPFLSAVNWLPMKAIGSSLLWYSPHSWWEKSQIQVPKLFVPLRFPILRGFTPHRIFQSSIDQQKGEIRWVSAIFDLIC